MSLHLAVMSSRKKRSEGLGTFFTSGCKSFGNDIVMFDVLIESASCFF